MKNTLKVSLEDQIVQSNGNIVSDMDGEKVMMSISNGKYYNLGEIGGQIWDLLKSPVSINQLIIKLHSIYEVEQSKCKDEVISFLELLYKEGLIQIERK